MWYGLLYSVCNKPIAITRVPWGYKNACLAQIYVGVYTMSQKKQKYNLKQDTQFKGGQSYKLGREQN